jgi:hypothetical protein
MGNAHNAAVEGVFIQYFGFFFHICASIKNPTAFLLQLGYRIYAVVLHFPSLASFSRTSLKVLINFLKYTI